MRYSALRDFIIAGLAADATYADPFILAGPDDEDTPPGRFLMLTPIGGPGFNSDGLFDGRSWQAMVAGEQRSYDDAEGFAFAVDSLLTQAWSQSIGGKWCTGFTRQGGPPTPLPAVDDADRTRFTCNYIADVQSNVVA